MFSQSASTSSTPFPSQTPSVTSSPLASASSSPTSLVMKHIRSPEDLLALTEQVRFDNRLTGQAVLMGVLEKLESRKPWDLTFYSFVFSTISSMPAQSPSPVASTSPASYGISLSGLPLQNIIENSLWADPVFAKMLSSEDPLVPCLRDKDANGVISFRAAEYDFMRLTQCARLGGSPGHVFASFTGDLAKIGGVPSTRIPARTAGKGTARPDTSGYRPLPFDSQGRPPICGRAAEHFRRWLASKGYDATYTGFQCTFKAYLICENKPWPWNRKKTMGRITYGHAITDIHFPSGVIYLDPSNGNTEVDLDGNNDRKVSGVEPNLHSNLGAEATNSIDIPESDPHYPLMKEKGCNGQKPLRMELKPEGPCLVYSFNSKAEAERAIGKIPDKWEDWQPRAQK